MITMMLWRGRTSTSDVKTTSLNSHITSVITVDCKVTDLCYQCNACLCHQLCKRPSPTASGVRPWTLRLKDRCVVVITLVVSGTNPPPGSGTLQAQLKVTRGGHGGQQPVRRGVRQEGPAGGECVSCGGWVSTCQMFVCVYVCVCESFVDVSMLGLVRVCLCEEGWLGAWVWIWFMM